RCVCLASRPLTRLPPRSTLFPYTTLFRSLKIRVSGNLVKSTVVINSHHRFANGQPFTTFGCNNYNTVGTTDPIKCRSSLTFQYVNAGNISRVYIQCSVGYIRSCNTIPSRIRGSRCDRHPIHYIERGVVSGKRSGTTNHKL